MLRWSLPSALPGILLLAGFAQADPPVASYIFPAGGQRGKTVAVRVGGLNLYKTCSFEMLGAGVETSRQLRSTATLWFEGPLLPMPDSQRTEDYPRDFAGSVRIAADAPLGVRHWRLWNAQGATPAMKFQVGDLPEIVEAEIDGDPVPTPVTLPVTINGRIFPRENVDVWVVEARKGQTIRCEVVAARLGSPLDSRLEVRDPHGRRIAENDDAFGADSMLRFTASEDGKYQVRIHDINYHGGQAYVYRLTLTADPHVDRVYPLGGRRGSKTSFQLAGQGVPSLPVEGALPASGAPDYLHRFSLGGKLRNPVLLDLDDLPELREVEPNDDPRQVKPVPVPAMLNGRIDRPGDVDHWAFAARKGEVLELELRAARLGSPLDGVLAVLDASGKELSRAENVGPGQLDPALRFTAPADGTYVIRVRDRFHSRGGPDFAYRLRVGRPAAADFRLRLAGDALTVNRAGQARLKVLAERQGGFAGPITLTVEGLPRGVTTAGTTIAARQAALDVTFKAEANAPVQVSHLTIRGSAQVGGETVTRTAVLPAPRGEPELDRVLLAVALPTPFKIKSTYDMGWAARGGVRTRRYQIERNGFDGPLEIRLADRQARHLQGVTGPTLVVPAGATEFTYPVYLPPWMEIGRTCRVCVMGIGLVKDADGSEYAVTFTSTQPNEQLIAVVETGRLDVDVDRTSLTAEPGKTAALSVQVTRGKALRGPVRLELVTAAHLHGIVAPPVVIPATESRAELSIHFAHDMHGPFNLPVVIRATLMDHGQPVIAEAKIEVQPER